MRKALAILALALSLTLVSCSDGAGPGSRRPTSGELAQQRELWGERGIEDYVLTVRRVCECLPEAIGPVEVRVRDGVAVSRTYRATGLPVDPPHADLFPTVEGLFDAVEDGIRRDAERLEVEYAPLGFPSRVLIDVRRLVGDDEMVLEASELVPEEGRA
ncbi:MAG TPA: DUF6174 domain-containing protein [Gemmatimonadota bacterium]